MVRVGSDGQGRGSIPREGYLECIYHSFRRRSHQSLPFLNEQGRQGQLVGKTRVVKAVELFFVLNRGQPFKVVALEEKGKKE